MSTFLNNLLNNRELPIYNYKILAGTRQSLRGLCIAAAYVIKKICISSGGYSFWMLYRQNRQYIKIKLNPLRKIIPSQLKILRWRGGRNCVGIVSIVTTR